MPHREVQEEAVRILVFAASLRVGSYNERLARLVTELLRDRGVEVTHAGFREFEVPLYDADLQSARGIPEGARRLERALLEHDAFVISTPEYNYSMPGTLKNLVDWVSRIRPHQPFQRKPGLLVSASPSAIGGQRGLWHARVPFEALEVLLYPEMFGLAHAGDAFDEAGHLKRQDKRDRLTGLLERFVALVRAVRRRDEG